MRELKTPKYIKKYNTFFYYSIPILFKNLAELPEKTLRMISRIWCSYDINDYNWLSRIFYRSIDSYIQDSWASVPPHNQADLAS